MTLPGKITTLGVKKVAGSLNRVLIAKRFSINAEYVAASHELLRRYLLLRLIKDHHVLDKLGTPALRARITQRHHKLGKASSTIDKQMYPTLIALLHCISNGGQTVNRERILHEILVGLADDESLGSVKTILRGDYKPFLAVNSNGWREGNCRCILLRRNQFVKFWNRPDSA